MVRSSFTTRFMVFGIAVGILVVVILVQYGLIMLAPGAGSADADSHTERGTILDRNGRILAVQSTVYTLVAWKPAVKDIPGSANLLAPATHLPADEIRERLITAEGSVIIKRRMNYAEMQDIKNFLAANPLPGFSIDEDSGRTYPNGSQLANVLGFVGLDGHGLEGLEFAYDSELREGAGKLNDGIRYGNQLMLTVDLDIQNQIEGLATKAIADNAPEGFMLLVLDAQNADILAWVSRPSYDSNNYGMSTPEQRRNRPITFMYEPGSVFKIFSISSILQLGGITPSTTFDTSGGFKSKLFRDPITDLGDYGVIDAEGIIVHSSNVGAAYASEQVEQQPFYDMVKAFGFGDRTGVELAGEERGLVKAVSAWSGRTKPTIAIGQELGVTAIQMATAATAIANGGTLLRPHLVRRIIQPSGPVIREFTREPVRQVIKPEIAQLILKYMHTAAEEGTGIRSNVKGVNISVKTGTAQMIDPKTGKYSASSFIASALAIFPTEAPQVIVYVVIVHPRGESTLGGRIAAPILKDAAEYLIPQLGIDRVGDRKVIQSPQVSIQIPNTPILADRVPNFAGLPLRTIMPLLSQTRYPVRVHGSGWVAGQTPSAGTPLTDGMTIDLYLEERAAP